MTSDSYYGGTQFNATYPLGSAFGYALYQAPSASVNVGLMSAFYVLAAVGWAVAGVAYRRNWAWMRLHESLPYFSSREHWLAFNLAATGGCLSLLQFAQGLSNTDPESIFLVIGCLASGLSLRFLHWAAYCPSTVPGYFLHSLAALSALSVTTLVQLQQLARQARVTAALKSCFTAYCFTTSQAAVSFTVTACLAFLCFAVLLFLVSRQVYCHASFTKYRSMHVMQRSFLIQVLIAGGFFVLLVFPLAFASVISINWANSPSLSPNQIRILASPILSLKWSVLLVGPPSLTLALLWSSLGQSVPSPRFLVTFNVLVMVFLPCVSGLMGGLISTVWLPGNLPAAYSVIITLAGSFIAFIAFELWFVCLYLIGWRGSSASGETLPLLMDTQSWGAEIQSVKSKSKGFDLNFLVQDRDIIKIPSQEVTIMNQLGSGGFGVVYLGVWQKAKAKSQNRVEVAIKKLHFSASTSPESLQDFMIEIKFLSRLDHPNILKFLGVVVQQEESGVWMLTEFMGGGSLKDIIGPAVSLPTKVGLLVDVCDGMSFLHAHQPPITHRDLKLENVLISVEGRAKIADFGLTVVQDHTMTQTVYGSLHIIAPEVFRKQKYDERIDIYSFGIMAAELVTGASFQQQLRSLVEWDFAIVEKIMQGARPELPNSLPDALRNILIESWVDVPGDRPPFHELAQRLRRLHATLT